MDCSSPSLHSSRALVAQAIGGHEQQADIRRRRGHRRSTPWSVRVKSTTCWPTTSPSRSTSKRDLVAIEFGMDRSAGGGEFGGGHAGGGAKRKRAHGHCSNPVPKHDAPSCLTIEPAASPAGVAAAEYMRQDGQVGSIGNRCHAVASEFHPARGGLALRVAPSRAAARISSAARRRWLPARKSCAQLLQAAFHRSVGEQPPDRREQFLPAASHSAAGGHPASVPPPAGRCRGRPSNRA